MGVEPQQKAVNFKWVAAGVALQFITAALLLNIPPFGRIFLFLNKIVLSLDEAIRAGTSFVFGYIGGGSPPFAEKDPVQLALSSHFRRCPLY